MCFRENTFDRKRNPEQYETVRSWIIEDRSPGSEAIWVRGRLKGIGARKREADSSAAEKDW